MAFQFFWITLSILGWIMILSIVWLSVIALIDLIYSFWEREDYSEQVPLDDLL